MSRGIDVNTEQTSDMLDVLTCLSNRYLLTDRLCCASRQSKYETDILSEPGASIEMGRVSAAEGNVFESDALGMLREAINQELEQRQIRWSGDASRPRFILNATIINYEMGNSFKRWLLPGWGGQF